MADNECFTGSLSSKRIPARNRSLLPLRQIIENRNGCPIIEDVLVANSTAGEISMFLVLESGAVIGPYTNAPWPTPGPTAATTVSPTASPDGKSGAITNGAAEAGNEVPGASEFPWWIIAIVVFLSLSGATILFISTGGIQVCKTKTGKIMNINQRTAPGNDRSSSDDETDTDEDVIYHNSTGGDIDGSVLGLFAQHPMLFDANDAYYSDDAVDSDAECLFMYAHE